MSGDEHRVNCSGSDDPRSSIKSYPVRIAGLLQNLDAEDASLEALCAGLINCDGSEGLQTAVVGYV